MTLQSALCATFVDEFYRAGVRHAVLAPGSRSSPLAIALLEDGRLAVHVRLDERSGAFFALGLALGSNAPAVMLTTSGTAAAEVHAAIVEADLADVPLIICTADRPPELHTVGAPQTIDQTHLYGRSVRYFVEVGVADEENRPIWRSIASRLVAEARSSTNGPGPVHANLPFREPLVGPFEALPPGRADGSTWHVVQRDPSVSAREVELFSALLARSRRGLFLVGGGASEDGGAALLRLAEQLSWPILNDGRGVIRQPHGCLVGHADGLLRGAELRAALEPDLVVHLGAPHASRVVATWSGGLGAATTQVLVDPFGSFEDAERVTHAVIGALPDALLQAVSDTLPPRPVDSWLSSWRVADDAAETAIQALIAAHDSLTEPGIARRTVELAPPGAALFSSSSMPIRDLEWFAPAKVNAPQVFANRGANGIDGVVSTTLGLASSISPERRVIGLLGDLAFFHDLSGFVWGKSEDVPDALLVVIDNNGGGIFSFLAYPDLLDRATYERAFGTPQVPEIARVAESLGVIVREVDSPSAFDKAFSELIDLPGIRMLLARTDREENLAFHNDLNAAMLAAANAALS